MQVISIVPLGIDGLFSEDIPGWLWKFMHLKLEKIYKNFNTFKLCNGVLTQTVKVP